VGDRHSMTFAPMRVAHRVRSYTSLWTSPAALRASASPASGRGEHPLCLSCLQ